MVDRYGNDALGAPGSQVSEQVPQPLWYAGYVYDRELGWYWLSTRSYDPNLKRFLQPDPSEQEGAQGYIYAGDDPFDATDPSGLWPCILGHGDCGTGGSGVETAAAGVGLVVLGAVTDVVSPFALLAGPEAAPVTAGGEEAGTSLIEAGVGLLGGGGARAALVATATLAAAHATGDAVRAIQTTFNSDESISPAGASPIDPQAAQGEDTAAQPRMVDPASLGFSQNTAGGRGRAASLRQSMKERGYDGDPLDVVDTPEGLTTIDNTRAAVAQELGIPEVPVVVHSVDELLPDTMAGRFGESATWGEALAYRTGNQRPPLPPFGTRNRPRLPSE